MSGNCVTRIINARLLANASEFTSPLSIRGYRYMKVTQINFGITVVGDLLTHNYLLYSSLSPVPLGSFFQMASSYPETIHTIDDIEGTHSFQIFDVTTGLPMIHNFATNITITLVFHRDHASL